jgi:hypothetical protein
MQYLQKAAKTSVKLFFNCIYLVKKNGPSIQERERRTIRSSELFLFSLVTDQTELNAKKVLCNFLTTVKDYCESKTRIIATAKGIKKASERAR